MRPAKMRILNRCIEETSLDLRLDNKPQPHNLQWRASSFFLASGFSVKGFRIKPIPSQVPAQSGRCYSWTRETGLDTSAPRSPVRFGIFEVDFASGELRRQGVRIKLQEQPFQALVALLERPREVLTREELQKRLWPTNTVDFDIGLNKAINRLREALGDDADNPRFIETLPQRGYRFIAPVETAGADLP